MLQHIALVGCNSFKTCWPDFLPLTSLCKLEFLGTLVITCEKFAYFAAPVGTSMTIRIDSESMQEAEFHDCEMALEEARQALGLLERDCGIVKCIRI